MFSGFIGVGNSVETKIVTTDYINISKGCILIEIKKVLIDNVDIEFTTESISDNAKKIIFNDSTYDGQTAQIFCKYV
jgi:hypothetical protein